MTTANGSSGGAERPGAGERRANGEDLLALFTRHFRVQIAETDEDVREAQRLRYQVYCLEHGFEDPGRCRDGLETDPYDERSVHTLLRSTYDGQTIGTVRLVLANRDDPARAFPIEEHCARAFLPGFRADRLPRPRLAEISRFAVSRNFRKRRGEPETTHGITEEATESQRRREERRVLPHLTLGLFRGIVLMSERFGVSHWYAVMEWRLIRSLRRFGIDFPLIGRPVQYHGERYPCLGVAADVLAGLRSREPEVWEFVTRNVDLGRLGVR